MTATSEDRTADVVVVGAGPAGSAAAITLARAGLDVTVLDRATFPRDKICGDGLTTGALRLLEQLGLDPADVASWNDVSDCFVSGPNGFTRRFPLPRGAGRFAAVATRLDLDAALVDLARKEGAGIREGCTVTGADEDSTGVRLTVEGGDGPEHLRARWVVAADGMWSPMRKHLGVADPGYRGDWHAFRQYFRDVTGPASRDLYVRFEADLLPGYFWAFPLAGGRANVGFGIERGGKVAVGDMGPLWRDLLDRPAMRDLLGPDARPEGPHRAWPIPARVGRLVPTTRRTLFVGDAVAACDVMTGEGIGQALLTGMRAAEAVRDRGALGDAAATYAAQLHDDLVADDRMSALLVRALRHRKGARAAIRVAGATPWTRRNFARWLFEDYPRAVVVTPRRWHRRLFTSPGAWDG
ncbi:MAG: NAD(P)/FAD-dependent oxidoreductase [Microthrixaceae bacterium]